MTPTLTDYSEFKKSLSGIIAKTRNTSFNTQNELNSYHNCRNNIKKDANGCSKIDWFAVKDLAFHEARFIELEKSIQSELLTFVKQSIRTPLDNNRTAVVLAPSEYIYPFSSGRYKTLNVPTEVHTEDLNAFYICCLLDGVLTTFSHETSNDESLRIDEIVVAVPATETAQHVRFYEKELIYLLNVLDGIPDISKKLAFNRTHARDKSVRIFTIKAKRWWRENYVENKQKYLALKA